GELLTMTYADKNRLQTFDVRKASTRTDPLPSKTPPKPGQPAPSPALTSSDTLVAHFDPKTGQVQTIEQNDHFHYEEGTRKASANKALLDSPHNIITLEQSARMWDATGSASANRITIDQKSGDFVAEGNVNSTRLPDSKSSGSGLLDKDQAV